MRGCANFILCTADKKYAGSGPAYNYIIKLTDKFYLMYSKFRVYLSPLYYRDGQFYADV